MNETLAVVPSCATLAILPQNEKKCSRVDCVVEAARPVTVTE